MGDWVWRGRKSSECLQLAYLFCCPAHLVYFQLTPAGMGYSDDRMVWDTVMIGWTKGRKAEGKNLGNHFREGIR